MEIREPKESERELYNSLVTHALQSWEWGEFRKTTGVKVIRRIAFNKKKATSAFQLTIHKIPRTKYTIGYLPKCPMPNEPILEELRSIGKKENCIFIKLEPNIEKDIKILRYKHSLRSRDLEDIKSEEKIAPSILISQYPNIHLSPHPMFTNHAFQLDLTKGEDELLKNMHPKTRYNIRVAQKHGVEIVEDNSGKAFEEYIRLMHETTTRQRYYAHGETYHRKMWKALKPTIAHLLLAKYKKKTLAAWILFVFNNVLYYPYGTSSREHREVMASNLLMWEAIKYGKKIGCTLFDMWGALDENPHPKHPRYGFHKFKQGYGPRLVEFGGSYDLVLNPFLYQFYNFIHRVRWLYLRLRK